MKYDLTHFLKAHEFLYEKAVNELKNGKKTSHWMWVVFPQLVDLGNSVMSERYGIEDIEEASAYLAHPILGARLLNCCEILLSLKQSTPDITAIDIFGKVDAIKLKSSMTLFALVAQQASCAEPVFEEVLHVYFMGHQDSKTIALCH